MGSVAVSMPCHDAPKLPAVTLCGQGRTASLQVASPQDSYSLHAAVQADNRQKDQGKASQSLVAVKTTLDQVLSTVL